MASRFAHLERTLHGLIVPRFLDGDTTRAGSQTPADLDARLPYVLLTRTGGDRTVIDDNPFFDVDTFAELDGDAEQLASDICDFLLSKPFPLDYVFCIEAPRELPWREDGSIRRYGATYSASLRRVRV